MPILFMLMYFLCTQGLHKSEELKEVVKPKSLCIFLTKYDKLWTSDQTKERGFGLIRVLNCRKVNI